MDLIIPDKLNFSQTNAGKSKLLIKLETKQKILVSALWTLDPEQESS